MPSGASATSPDGFSFPRHFKSPRPTHGGRTVKPVSRIENLLSGPAMGLCKLWLNLSIV